MEDFPILNNDQIGRLYRGLEIPTEGLVQAMALEILKYRNLPTDFFTSKEGSHVR